MQSAESKSERIASIIEGEIRSGALENGAALESESALVRRFEVSRATVRKGLGILSAKGLIRTRVGIGSFVTFRGTVIDGHAGWAVALSDRSARIGTRILRIDRSPLDLPDTPLAPGSDVLSVDRIRFREETGQGITLERSRVPWSDALAPVLETGLAGGSLHTTLERAGLVATGGEEWANVLTALPPEDAALMGRVTGEAMLRLRRATRDATGTIVEYVESVLDPALFGLHMEF